MAKNRWGVEVRKGYNVVFALARGGRESGQIAKVENMPGYGKRATLTDGYSFSVDDVIWSASPVNFGENQAREMDALLHSVRKSNPVRKPAAKKPAAKRAYVNRPSQATKKPPTQRLKTRRAANVRGSGMFPNPLTVDRKTITRHSLVGGIYYAVLFYANKTKPTGKPSFVIPARDRKHALGFVKALRDQGASGVALIEKTVARV